MKKLLVGLMLGSVVHAEKPKEVVHIEEDQT
jgi:hypothetical protein